MTQQNILLLLLFLFVSSVLAQADGDISPEKRALVEVENAKRATISLPITTNITRSSATYPSISATPTCKPPPCTTVGGTGKTVRIGFDDLDTTRGPVHVPQTYNWLAFQSDLLVRRNFTFPPASFPNALLSSYNSSFNASGRIEFQQIARGEYFDLVSFKLIGCLSFGRGEAPIPGQCFVTFRGERWDGKVIVIRQAVRRTAFGDVVFKKSDGMQNLVRFAVYCEGGSVVMDDLVFERFAGRVLCPP